MRIELKIIDLLARNIDKKFTINEISLAAKEYYSFVHRTINKLTKDGVITKIKAGKAFLCSLNLNNEKTLTMIKLNEIEKKISFFNKNKELKLILDDFFNLLKEESNIVSAVLFGSYSKETAAEKSDIDILIIYKNTLNLEKAIKEIHAKYDKEINSIIMTLTDFKKQKDKVLIKEIINNHIVLYSAENFINLVFK